MDLSSIAIMRFLVACANGDTSKVSNVGVALTRHTPFLQRRLGRSQSSVPPALTPDEIFQTIGTVFVVQKSTERHLTVRRFY